MQYFIIEQVSKISLLAFATTLTSNQMIKILFEKYLLCIKLTVIFFFVVNKSCEKKKKINWFYMYRAVSKQFI